MTSLNGQLMGLNHLYSVWVMSMSSSRFLFFHFFMSVADMSAFRTGYGQHGDYLFGWKGNVLQTAMESSCFGATCKALKTQAFTDANKCAVPATVKEQVTDGCEFTNYDSKKFEYFETDFPF